MDKRITILACCFRLYYSYQDWRKSLMAMTALLGLSDTVLFMILFFATFTTLFPLQYIINQKAYADGLSVENLPPASVGNRQLSLYLKVNPPILTTAASHSAYMQFRLFNAANNQTIQHVTYLITVTRGISSSKFQKPLSADLTGGGIADR